MHIEGEIILNNGKGRYKLETRREKSITVVILTMNESVHIGRCIRSLRSVASNVFVVDSFSTDQTVQIAESLGTIVVQ
jgi:glycosyltransferase involved in cell wall biosynthesis